MSKIHTPKALAFGLVAALVAAAATLGVAHADTGDSSSVTAVSDMPIAIEDFSYPGAAEIEESTGGVVLKRGNGRLLYTSCDGSEDITIEAAFGQTQFCFKLASKPAFLEMEIPKAYGIWTTDDPVKATLEKADGTSKVLNAPAGEFTGYGESGADRERTTLIELRVEG
ncbi:hypothetical protein OG345_40500 (plasmid) [Streptomyces sp. NBC_01220]|uniref:Secreted protein n=1 Tax=Streptomyces poriferorum TaxID=2798799 RepID=A0ABY9J176_9ACTN|nr:MULTISPECIES: hypothetical protein [unclassified Streptomyces]MDP5309333.1 hypothetical protein [Streptomyces sp. Alt4]WLQ61461.1 hypothetical protein P8A19_41385 [Streptomyces sp. Alt2]WSQ49297.1 hypothetical protein OG345_40500 [Streptomyces sp. NBC_01220]